MTRVSKFAVENVFNSNATIVVLNSTKTTAINDNEIKKKNFFQNFISSLDAEPLSFIMKAKNFWSFGLFFLGPKAKKGQKHFFAK